MNTTPRIFYDSMGGQQQNVVAAPTTTTAAASPFQYQQQPYYQLPAGRMQLNSMSAGDMMRLPQQRQHQQQQQQQQLQFAGVAAARRSGVQFVTPSEERHSMYQHQQPQQQDPFAGRAVPLSQQYGNNVNNSSSAYLHQHHHQIYGNVNEVNHPRSPRIIHRSNSPTAVAPATLSSSTHAATNYSIQQGQQQQQHLGMSASPRGSYNMASTSASFPSGSPLRNQPPQQQQQQQQQRQQLLFQQAGLQPQQHQQPQHALPEFLEAHMEQVKSYYESRIVELEREVMIARSGGTAVVPALLTRSTQYSPSGVGTVSPRFRDQGVGSPLVYSSPQPQHPSLHDVATSPLIPSPSIHFPQQHHPQYLHQFQEQQRQQQQQHEFDAAAAPAYASPRPGMSLHHQQQQRHHHHPSYGMVSTATEQQHQSSTFNSVPVGSSFFGSIYSEVAHAGQY